MKRFGCLSLLFIALLSTCHAHSNLGQPIAYNRVSCKASEPWCTGPCPPIWKTGSSAAINSPENPAAVWKRGEKVEIIWHKNNHVGGIIRRALVPVKYMDSHQWHKDTAFEFGCWQQGSFNCGKGKDNFDRKCGGDLKNRAYKNTMVVPSVFPDGDYVFAQVWYGGLQWQKRYPKYSDYFACSFVRIEGGAELTEKHTATWNGPDETCETGSTKPLTCGGEACEKNPVIDAVPDEFPSPGATSTQVVESSLFSELVMKHNGMQTSKDMTMQKKAMTDMKADMMNDQNIGSEQQQVQTEQKIEPNESMSGTKPMGPIKAILVYNNYNVVERLYDDDVKTIYVDKNKPVSIRAFSLEGTNYSARETLPGQVFFKIEGFEQWIESFPPFLLLGNIGLDVKKYKALDSSYFDKPLVMEVVVWLRNGTRYSMTVTMTLDTSRK